jgi:hypothetical protein
MAASTGSDAPQPETRSRRVRRSRTSQESQADRPVNKGRPGDEAGFWAQLEEREFGRLALEADHLFDTSYPWAA